MIKKFIDKLLGKSTEAPRFGKRMEVAASVHKIDPTLVDIADRLRFTRIAVPRTGHF